MEAVRDEGDDNNFVSPTDARSIIRKLEEMDSRLIASVESAAVAEMDEGTFLAPADVEAPQERQKMPQQGVQSDLLTRIAGELRTIKSELGSLKQTYDALFRSSEAEMTREAPQKPSPPPPSGRMVPEDTFAEMVRLFGYLDKLLESLPEEKIDEFARSEYFDMYRRVFEYFRLS